MRYSRPFRSRANELAGPFVSPPDDRPYVHNPERAMTARAATFIALGSLFCSEHVARQPHIIPLLHECLIALRPTQGWCAPRGTMIREATLAVGTPHTHSFRRRFFAFGFAAEPGPSGWIFEKSRGTFVTDKNGAAG